MLLLLRLDNAKVVQGVEMFRLPIEEPGIKRLGFRQPALPMQCNGLPQELIQ
jgi:hypothetical protein